MSKVGVIGAGAWGTALAQLMADQGSDVMMWAYEKEVADDINNHHENKIFLPNAPLSERLRGTNSLEEAVTGQDLILLVCPSHVMRRVMTEAATYLPEGVPLVSAAKGIENDTLMTMSEVLQDVLPGKLHPMLGFLSGPSFAKELAAGQPTAVSVAASDEQVAVSVQNMMAAPYFRVYTSTDVVGVELGGALKNVVAIASGAADGMGFGYNAAAAIVTRGLAEVTRLAVKRGAHPLTLAGLAGMGDLVLTCMGGLSRNRTVGQKLGQGMTIEEVTADMRQVAEGVKTARSVYRLAQREGVDMPICAAVYRLLYEGASVKEAVSGLMTRSLKKELEHA